MFAYIYLALMALGGVLMMGLSVPLISGRVRRNAIYGFRTPKTLSSDSIWYPANRYAGRGLFAVGAVVTAGSLVLLPFAGILGKDGVAYAGMGLVLLPLAVMLVKSFKYLRTL